MLYLIKLDPDLVVEFRVLLYLWVFSSSSIQDLGWVICRVSRLPTYSSRNV